MLDLTKDWTVGCSIQTQGEGTEATNMTAFSSGGVSLNLKVQGRLLKIPIGDFMGQVMETYTIFLAVFKRTHGPALLMTLAFCGYIVQLRRNWHTTSLM